MSRPALKLTRINCLVLSAILAALFAGPLAAQGNGGISGTVTDPSGAGVPAAEVAVVEQSTGNARRAITEASGFYSISPLSPGSYRVSIEAAGFQRFEQSGIALRVDERLRVDAVMKIGAQTETVSINSQGIAVNTVDGIVRSVVDAKRMVDLPLNGRSPLQLLLLAPGVLPSPATGLGTSFQPQGQQFVASSGSKANAVNFVLDGGDNMDTYRDVANSFPNPDILQEFSVQTNSYSAEYGGRSGGVVNAVTKSGTNALHGTAFEFVRNAEFNARNFFAATTDGLKRNQYGGTIGGPVWIPRLYNGRNKTFFFFGVQETSVRQTPATSTARVLTDQQRGGDFSALRDGKGNPVAIKDPVNGQPFPGNMIPASRLNPVFQNFLKLVPSTTDPTGTVRYVIPVINDDLQYNVRIDQNSYANRTGCSDASLRTITCSRTRALKGTCSAIQTSWRNGRRTQLSTTPKSSARRSRRMGIHIQSLVWSSRRRGPDYLDRPWRENPSGRRRERLSDLDPKLLRRHAFRQHSACAE